MEDATRVSILGPIEVGTAGRRVPVAGIKQQSLLAMLALATPHAVSDDHLIDELWGDEQPANPANALQALVSQLRRLLGRDVVGRVGAGYVLRLDADDVDVTRLERLVEEGREAAARGDRPDAVERFRDAVALVRGPPLGDLADAWFARDAARPPRRARRRGQRGPRRRRAGDGPPRRGAPRCSSSWSAGTRSASASASSWSSPSTEPAVRRTPSRRSATPGEHLLEELGLDPGPELQALERAVLAHDPALAAPIALAPIAHDRLTLPAPLTSFVGRARELDALEATIATTRLTTVVGPGGVGKTRLVAELLRRTDGEVWFVELGPLTVAGAVAEAVAAGVGAPERAPSDGQPPPSPEQRAVERLRDRAAVVVLDNCEHVVAAAARCVLTLLAGCPRLRVVATSREPLGVEGERQFVVGPAPGRRVGAAVRRAGARRAALLHARRRRQRRPRRALPPPRRPAARHRAGRGAGEDAAGPGDHRAAARPLRAAAAGATDRHRPPRRAGGGHRLELRAALRRRASHVPRVRRVRRWGHARGRRAGVRAGRLRAHQPARRPLPARRRHVAPRGPLRDAGVAARLRPRAPRRARRAARRPRRPPRVVHRARRRARTGASGAATSSPGSSASTTSTTTCAPRSTTPSSTTRSARCGSSVR